MITSLLRVLGSGVTRISGGRLSILIYHRVLAEPDSMLFDEIDAQTFRTHMDTLASVCHVLPLSEAVSRLANGTLPPRAACVTFDDGYANNADIALPILLERKLPACFFIATGFLDGTCMWNDVVIETLKRTQKNEIDLNFIDLKSCALDDVRARINAMQKILTRLKSLDLESRTAAVDHLVELAGVSRPTGLMMSPDQVKMLSDSGMEIGAHTVNHPILTTISPAQARTEIIGSRDKLAEITGRPITLFAYPNGRPGQDFNNEHVQILRELRFNAAVTTAAGISTRSTDPLQLNRFTPWDRSHSRFALRLFQNALFNGV